MSTTAADILALIADRNRPLTNKDFNKAARRAVEARITERMAAGELVHFEETLLDALEKLLPASEELRQQLERLAKGWTSDDDITSTSLTVARAAAATTLVRHLIEEAMHAASVMAKYSEQLQATPEQRASTIEGVAKQREERIARRTAVLQKLPLDELKRDAGALGIGLANAPRATRQDLAVAIARAEDAKAGAK